MKQCPRCKVLFDDSWQVCLHDSTPLVQQKGASSPRNTDSRSAAHPKKIHRPAGVTIFGIFILLGSLIGIFNLSTVYQLNTRVSFFLYILVYPLSIVLSIFLLRMKNFARIAIIAFSLIVGVETIIMLPHVIRRSGEVYGTYLDDMTRQNVQAQMRAKKIDESRLTPEVMEKIGKISRSATQNIFKFVAMLSILFNIMVIYYFSLPAIKQSFTAAKKTRETI